MILRGDTSPLIPLLDRGGEGDRESARGCFQWLPIPTNGDCTILGVLAPVLSCGLKSALQHPKNILRFY